MDKNKNTKEGSLPKAISFPGVGKVETIADLKVRAKPRITKKTEKLGEWLSTAICGNDIGSSCLYVSSLAILAAGKLAPIALIVIGLVLYLFRKIYHEVVSAMPLNGGAYNALLNTTTKMRASVAACLTILSYIATAVISGSEAIHYAATLVPQLPVEISVLVLLSVFAILTFIGIGDSARVALGIFIFHITSLLLLCIFGILFFILHPEVLLANLQAPLPQSWPVAIFFGFAAAFLGVSGFESSANFVEEQKEGVFPKTLRNMWVIVIFFNPLIAFLALAIIEPGGVLEHKEALLAQMGHVSAGGWLQTLISIDATLVLSGAVLTAFVGSNGLIRRMTLDGCLPQFFLKQTPWKTDYITIGSFWLLACSIFLATKGELQSLARVYTLSFLFVMALFALGNILLKLRRTRLPRETRASWYEVGIGLFAVLLGLMGNIIVAGKNIFIFVNYFLVAMAIVSIMLLRSSIVTLILRIFHDASQSLTPENSVISKFFVKLIKNYRKKPIVYFSRGDDLANLNRAILYIKENESSSHIQITHIYQDKKEVSEIFKQNLSFLDRAYPDVRIDLLLIKGTFSPETIQALSRHLQVPINYMFISCPGDSFPHNVADLGGVRVIV